MSALHVHAIREDVEHAGPDRWRVKLVIELCDQRPGQGFTVRLCEASFEVEAKTIAELNAKVALAEHDNATKSVAWINAHFAEIGGPPYGYA